MSNPTEQSSGGLPPENPYGQPQNPYGQPQAPYGAPGMPPGAPFYPVQPEQGRSGLAIAALCTFWVPVLGLVLSIVGMVQTAPGKLRGRGLAIAALTLSIVATAAYGFAGYKIANKTSALDSGCINGKQAILDGSKKLDADSTAGDSSAMQSDIQTIVTKLNAAIAGSGRSDVKAAMQAASDDYNTLLSGLTTGNIDPNFESKLATDLNNIDKLCTIR